MAYNTNCIDPAGFGVNTLTVYVGKRGLSVFVSTIVRIEANGSYSWLYTRNGQRYLISRPINLLTRQLPDFWRIHKSFMVNPDYVVGPVSTVLLTGRLQLSTGDSVLVARRQKKKVCIKLNVKTALDEYQQ